MRYFPILDELFESDTFIILLIGLAFAIFFGIVKIKKHGIGISVCAVIYVLCEILSNFVHDFLFEIIFLFIGTFALGSLVGFIVAWIISKVRKHS